LVKKASEIDMFLVNQIEAIKNMRNETAIFFRDIIKRQRFNDKKLSNFQKRKEQKKERREAKKQITVPN
jgi:predicted acylesterase/phospholipase RssA